MDNVLTFSVSESESSIPSAYCLDERPKKNTWYAHKNHNKSLLHYPGTRS